MKSISIGYSPCPNDTYVFAHLNGDPGIPLRFRPVLADVETLNQWALETRLGVTKLSFFALGRALRSYALLHAGSALGRGCGPIVVARPGTSPARLRNGRVAAPGELTTARLLLSLYLGRPPRFSQMVFSRVMPAVVRGEAEFGLVIHEGRFTYREYGLEVLLDLGRWWEKETGRPIPLGGIAIRRDLGPDTARDVDRAIRSSLKKSENNASGTMAHVRAHAQEMAPDVIRRHIRLYVNRFTTDLGATGREAVTFLLRCAGDAGLIRPSTLPLMAY